MANGALRGTGLQRGVERLPRVQPHRGGTWSRANAAVYGDLEVRGGEDAWTLGSALRLEDFAESGTGTNGKLSGRLRLALAAALRASASTGVGPRPRASRTRSTSTSATITR